MTYYSTSLLHYLFNSFLVSLYLSSIAYTRKKEGAQKNTYLLNIQNASHSAKNTVSLFVKSIFECQFKQKSNKENSV